MWRSFRSYHSRLISHAHALRKQETPAEKKFWELLRILRASHAIKFRRQQPIGIYIADFYSAAFKCVVEIDGASHDGKLQKDQERDAFMIRQGLRVVRFTEKEIIDNPYGALETLLDILGVRTPPPTPPSRGGE